jgi:ATP-dependent DNA ligase
MASAARKAPRRALRRWNLAALSPLVAGVHCILFSDALVAEGALVFAKACELGLEGIVSKRAGSRYSSGNSRQWLKSKNPEFERT